MVLFKALSLEVDVDSTNCAGGQTAPPDLAAVILAGVVELSAENRGSACPENAQLLADLLPGLPRGAQAVHGLGAVIAADVEPGLRVVAAESVGEGAAGDAEVNGHGGKE